MHEQEMASHFISNAPLPRGFSVYQPALGAQLQFFPALGSRELDDLMNAFIPGPASLKEKRASVSLDFLEYTQLTGRNFKFYTISPASAATSFSSPVPNGSSFNISPLNSIAAWELSGAPGAVSVSPSPSSTQTRKSPKASASSLHGRSATDLSHLPGMKIMTKDGLDVTNSASRGSKTKEQRDHAHLMRIIKACDNCRRKKIRCDPSHKKRPASQAQSPKFITKLAKRARTAVQKPPTTVIPATDLDAFMTTQPSLLFEPTFTFADLKSLDPLVGVADPLDPWDQFVQYPPLDTDTDNHLFFDLEHYISSQSPSSSSQTSESLVKSLTPLSDEDSSLVPGADHGVSEGTETPPRLPYLDSSSSFANYIDFNLFSPSSSFLEDELMIPISCHRRLDPAESQLHSSNEIDPGSGLGSPAGMFLGIEESSRRAIRSSGEVIPGAPPGVSSSFPSSPDLVEGDQFVIQETSFTTSPSDDRAGRFAPESSCEAGVLAPTGEIWGDPELSPGESARKSFLSPHGIGARSPWNAAISPTRDGNHLTTGLQSQRTSGPSSSQGATRAGDNPQDQAQFQARQATAAFCLTPAYRPQETEQQRALATTPRPGETHSDIATASVPLLDPTTSPVAPPDLAFSGDRQLLSTTIAAPPGETSTTSIRAARSATSRGQESSLCATRSSNSRPTEVSTSLQHAHRKLPACATGKTLKSSEGSTRDALMPNDPQAAPLLATALIIMVLGGFARNVLLQFVATVLLAGAAAHECMKNPATPDTGCGLLRTADASRTLITRLTDRGSRTKDGVSFAKGLQKLAVSRALRVGMV